MKVFNVSGTSDRKCDCGSWKNHWINFSKKEWPALCSESTCLNEATVGAHVCLQRGGKSFIIPLCYEHSAVTEAIEISDDTVMVPSNVSETCGCERALSELEKALLKFLSEKK